MTASSCCRLAFVLCLLVGTGTSLCADPEYDAHRDTRQNAMPPSMTELRDRFASVDFSALRMAIRDLAQSFPSRYPKGEEYLAELDAIQPRRDEIRDGLARGETNAIAQAKRLLALQREALEANPDDLQLVDGVVEVKGTPSKSIPLTQVAVLANPLRYSFSEAARAATQFAGTANLDEPPVKPGQDPGLEATGWYSPVRK